MTPVEYGERLYMHVRKFFAGHGTRSVPFDRGPIRRIVPGFQVIQVDPGPRHQRTTYISVGAGFPTDQEEFHIEFIATAEEPGERHIEILAMTAHYHLTGERLGLGHTFPIGEPWLPGSTLDHMLVCLPYPYGPNLELLRIEEQEVRLLWLLPITTSERTHKSSHGLDALETLFDAAPLHYWDPYRKAVV